jgi:hypothetical protein
MYLCVGGIDFVNLVENSISVNTWNVYANTEKSFEKNRKNYDLEKVWPVFTAEKRLTLYVELHICGRILIISASISTVTGLLMSARLCVLDIPFNNCLTINELVLSVRLFIFIETVESGKSSHVIQKRDVILNRTDKSVSVTINSSKTDQYGLKTRLVLNSEFVNVAAPMRKEWV